MRRLLLAALMNAGLHFAVPAFTSAASAETFVPVRLTAWDSEDWTGPDEISMRYLGHDWQASLNTHQDGYPDARSFGGSFRIDLWELDAGRWWDPHDFLGGHTVHASENGLGERYAHFDGHGTHYELLYRVEP